MVIGGLGWNMKGIVILKSYPDSNPKPPSQTRNHQFTISFFQESAPYPPNLKKRIKLPYPPVRYSWDDVMLQERKYEPTCTYIYHKNQPRVELVNIPCMHPIGICFLFIWL